jgi:ABC-type branched-subunit amino acid transport system substrate-binding protein/ABC-type nitrate/sulfonate/bicarbonate transport system substrate-binding protein
MRNRRLLRLLAVLFAFVLVAAACGDDDDSSSSSGSDASASSSESSSESSSSSEAEASDSGSAEGLNMGTLLPETGALAFLSEPLVLAVDMAIRDINAAGGVNGADVTLTKGDSGTDPDIANTTVDRLLTENVDAIVGAAASGITGSVIEKITSAGVTQCSPSNTAAGLGTSGDDGYYFRTAPSDDLQAPALANVVLGDGYTNVAVVSRADDYGVGFNAEFEPAVAAGGGTIVYSEPYAPESTSFDDVVADVIASGPDAVVIVAFEEGVQLIQAMVEQGAGPQDIQIYITDGMATGELGALIDEANPSIASGMKGTQPAAAPSTGAAFFPGAFAEFAPDVSTIFSAQSYDCAILIALAAEAAGSNNSADIAAQMVAVSRDGEKCSTFADCKALLADGADIDYDGASGAIDFLDVGEPGTGIYEVYEYDADGVQQVVEELTFESSGAAEEAAPEPAGIGLNKLPEMVTMSTTCAPSIASLPQWIAVDAGLYAERNLTLECVQIGSGPETAAALASGDADFAANIYNNVFPLLNNGLEVVVFMETLLYNLFDVIVDADFAEANGITSGMDWQEAMEALDCTNVGVVARGAAAEDLARILIQEAGLDEECFTYVAVGLQPLPGLESGDTDWTVTFDPFQVVAVQTGAGVNPFSIQRGEGPAGLDWPGLVYMTGKDTFEAKQAELCAYKSGTVAAIEWLADPANAEAAGDIAKTRLAEALHPLVPALIEKYQNAFSTTGDIQFGQIETISQISVDVGKTDRLFAADEVAQDLDCE